MGRGAGADEEFGIDSLSEVEKAALNRDRWADLFRERFASISYWKSGKEAKEALWTDVGGEIAAAVALFHPAWDNAQNRLWCAAVVRNQFRGMDFWMLDKEWKERRYYQFADQVVMICKQARIYVAEQAKN